jgi:hypothetical protein
MKYKDVPGEEEYRNKKRKNKYECVFKIGVQFCVLPHYSVPSPPNDMRKCQEVLLCAREVPGSVNSLEICYND